MSEPATLGVEFSLPLRERLFMFLEVCSQPIEERHRPIKIRIVDGRQLVFEEHADGTAHGDTDDIAIPLPRRPHGIGYRHLDELRTLPMIEFSQHPTIDSSQHPTVKCHRDPHALLPHTIASN